MLRAKDGTRTLSKYAVCSSKRFKIYERTRSKLITE